MSCSLAALTFAALVATPDAARAACTVTVAGSVTCSTATTTTNTTNTDGATTPSSDRIQLWDNGTAITGSTTGGITIDGYGLMLQETGSTPAAISMTNGTGNLIRSDAGSATPALELSGNGGAISYSGDGSITGNDQQGIYATNTGGGTIDITTTGTISAGDGLAGDNFGVQTTAATGLTTIDLTGSTIQGATAGGMADSAGISSTSSGGGITITSNNIGGVGDQAGTGIDASISGGAGAIGITSLGDIYAVNTGISATNNGVGGVTLNLNSGSNINTLGASAVGEYVRVTGAGGGITINNQVNTLIDPATGVDAQITNTADSSNVSIHQDGDITATSVGIIAATFGAGNIAVDGAGNVVGGTGVATSSLGADVSGTGFGILAIQNGAAGGGISIGGTGATSGTVAIGAEIHQASNTSNILINRSGAITVTGAGGTGILANTNGTGNITVQSTGAISSSGAGTIWHGILASSAGGNVLVNNVGAITADFAGGTGIGITTSGTGTLTVDGTGAITSTGDAISATTTGSGDVEVVNTGIVTGDSGVGGTGTGILASTQGGNITITPGSAVSGAVGISATTSGSGVIGITVTPTVSAHSGDAIYGSAVDGNIQVTANGTVSSSSGGDGIDLVTSGAGAITVTGSATVSGDTGGIVATESGLSSGAGTNGILITGSGATGSTAGPAISATITNAANHSDISVIRSGTITAGAGGGSGIIATTAGLGNVTVQDVSDVAAGTGGGATGIDAESNGGNVLVDLSTPTLGTSLVSGGNGINASSTGSGNVTVTTASGAAGNVTGLAGIGVSTSAVNGDTVITNSANTVSGTTWGSVLLSFGTGAITVQGSGDYVGGTSGGIGASLIGASPGIGNKGIWITGSGNTSTTTGVGIEATITNAANNSDIVIDRTGTVTVGASGGAGIYATTAGSGNITVDGVGAVTAGTNAGPTGIWAVAAGGNVQVTPASTVHGGNNGIWAVTTGSGTVTATTLGDITGNVGDGIHAASVDGDINVATAAGTAVVGAASGGTGDGIDARASGAGNVTVLANSTVSGDPGIIATSATGNVHVTANALVSALTTGIYADVTSAAATSDVLVDGTGSVIAGTHSIYANNAGSGTTTVSGSGNVTANGGQGIRAYAVSGDVLVNRTGTVTATTNGINAQSSGGGNVTVSGVGDTSGGTGYGIYAAATGGNGNVSVTPAGTVSGTTGISASADGTGTVTVTMASGAAGNVTGTAGNGIETVAVDGDTVVTNNADTVSGTASGAFDSSLGLGAITVTGGGDYNGGSSYGIGAQMLGVGPAAGNGVSPSTNAGIWITGTGNASSTSATGIYAHILNAANASDIVIDRSGTASGGVAGIYAATAGSGNITIDGVGDVTGGTLAGIYAYGSGGNVQVTPAGTVSGSAGITASTIGSGTVTVTTAGDITGNADYGIYTSAVDGDTQVNVNGGTAASTGSGLAGVNSTANGTGNLGVTVAGGATLIGVKLSQTGTGSNTITNSGTITGVGTLADPVISIATTAAGASLIDNGATGLITSANATVNDRPGDLAIYSPVTTGANTIDNAGTLIGEVSLSNAGNVVDNSGDWYVHDNAGLGSDAAEFGTGGANVLTNSGSIYAGDAMAPATSTFTDVQTINNNGGSIFAGLFGTSDVTTFDAGAGNAQTVTNTGTFYVHGTLSFVGDATFNNAGGVIDMRTAGSATTDVTALNVAVSGNTYTPGAAYDFNGGNGSEIGLDTFIGGQSSAGSVVPSDRLLISGNATSTTAILVNDTNAGPGTLNTQGIILVAVNGSSSGAFYLGGVSSVTGADLLVPGYGPLGAIRKGFWIYPLVQTSHAQALADGLTGANSTEYRLYSLPSVEAFQMPFAMTGAQNIWYQTALGWDSRQQDIRKYWSIYDGEQSAEASGSKPNLWLKVSGHWTDRTASHSVATYLPTSAVLSTVDTSFNQNVATIQAGTDTSIDGIWGGVLVVGASAGYAASSLDFKNSPNAFDFTGATLSASGDYLNGPWFADVLLKADFLKLDMKFKSLRSLGRSTGSTRANTYGVLSNAGYHWILNGSALGQGASTYLEPILTLAYTRSDLNNLIVAGTTLAFGAGETVRGAAGARLGTHLATISGLYLDGSITARYWNEFANETIVTLRSPGSVLPMDDRTREKGYGEVVGMLNFADRHSGWSGFLNGGATFNRDAVTVRMGGGVRYQW